MASFPEVQAKGRNFTPDELIGQQIRIDLQVGQAVGVICGDEMVYNACKAVITMEARCATEAKLSLYRLDLPDAPIEEITLRDNIELSFSALVSEVG